MSSKEFNVPPRDDQWYGTRMLLLRLFAWLLAVAVTFATLGPPQDRPHSNLGHIGEHSAAFILLGLAFALAYPRHRLLAARTIVIMTCLLEFLQLIVPGRHARIGDLVVDTLAALVSFAIVTGIDLTLHRRKPVKADRPTLQGRRDSPSYEEP